MKHLKTVCILFVICFSLLPFSTRAASQPGGLFFERRSEPVENAFTILVPKGWLAKGGIFRVDPLQAGGPLNAMAAKCDLTYQSDAAGTVFFRTFPEYVYAHAGIGGGFFPTGSYYQGAEIRPFTDAKTYLKLLFAHVHPNAAGMNIRKLTRLPGEKAAIESGLAYTNRLFQQIGLSGMTFTADAAGAVFEYMENGTAFTEVMISGIVDMRAAMTWKNTRTLMFRAPTESFEDWRPVMDIMRFSVQLNPAWVLMEAQGQQQRAAIVMQVFDEVRRIDRKIAANTAINREEIMNDNYLVLTEQEEFVNPHTGKIETDTDAYRYRWETAGGDIYYTNRESEDPNTFLAGGHFQRTPIRKRRNEP